MADDTKKGELVIERIFDAPRQRVWDAWTKPEQMMRWWGPKGFTAPECKIDFREGGKYLVSMQSPEFNHGEPIWSTGVYREIKPQVRIAYTDNFADAEGNVVSGAHYGMDDLTEEFQVTVTFEDYEDDKTRMTLRHAGFPNAEESSGANVGWNESFDKLAETVK